MITKRKLFYEVYRISDLEIALFFLPARMGGLGVHDPVELCDVDFTSSQAGLLLYLMQLEVVLNLIVLNTWLECKLLLFLTVKGFNLG